MKRTLIICVLMSPLLLAGDEPAPVAAPPSATQRLTDVVRLLGGNPDHTGRFAIGNAAVIAATQLDAESQQAFERQLAGLGEAEREDRCAKLVLDTTLILFAQRAAEYERQRAQQELLQPPKEP